MYRIAVWSIFISVLLTGLKRLRSNLSTTRYDLTPTGQRGKLYEKILFTFDFHILPEHRCIGDKIFPCRCISIKKRRSSIAMRSVLTHLLGIETVSELLDCGRKSRNYVHIDTY